MQDGHADSARQPACRARKFGRTAVLVALLELVLLQSVVDAEVWIRLGGHGIDPHVVLVMLGFAAAGVLVAGVMTAGLVHAVAVTSMLRAVLALAAGLGARHDDDRRRRRRHDPLRPRGAMTKPAGARGPRAPGSMSRRPSARDPARCPVLAT